MQVVLVTCGNMQEAEKIAEELVQKKLAACVNILPAVTSIYKWQGKLQKEAEILLIIKSRKELFAELQNLVVQLHSYHVPEVVAIAVHDAFQPYLSWVDENTKKN